MKKNLKSLPKLHLACASDGLRPVFDHILVTKDEVVATDMHVLIIHKTKSIFSEEFIEQMPDEFLIHKTQWKKFYNNHLGILFENNSIHVVYDGYNMIFPVKIGDSMLKFPDYKTIIPDESKKEAIINVGIDVSCLNKIKNAMFRKGDNKKVIFEFYGKNKSLMIFPEDDTIESKSLLMPLTIK